MLQAREGKIRLGFALHIGATFQKELHYCGISIHGSSVKGRSEFARVIRRLAAIQNCSHPSDVTREGGVIEFAGRA